MMTEPVIALIVVWILLGFLGTLYLVGAAHRRIDWLANRLDDQAAQIESLESRVSQLEDADSGPENDSANESRRRNVLA